MYYFIPAWYGQTDEFWKTAIDPWYRIRQKIEFDDSLHQVRIFQDEDLAPQLLLLAYQPHLRYFLHRHDVLEVGYTAIFDLIQGITLAGVFCDEVALMPESFANQATGRCSVTGSKYWFNCNPDGPYHWFKVNWIDKAIGYLGKKKAARLQEEAAAKGTELNLKKLLYVHFTMDDNLSL